MPSIKEKGEQATAARFQPYSRRDRISRISAYEILSSRNHERISALFARIALTDPFNEEAGLLSDIEQRNLNIKDAVDDAGLSILEHIVRTNNTYLFNRYAIRRNISTETLTTLIDGDSNNLLMQNLSRLYFSNQTPEDLTIARFLFNLGSLSTQRNRDGQNALLFCDELLREGQAGEGFINFCREIDLTRRIDDFRRTPATRASANSTSRVVEREQNPEPER
jgi:hypothetical protein